jgi:hypothetical protein
MVLVSVFVATGMGLEVERGGLQGCECHDRSVEAISRR